MQKCKLYEIVLALRTTYFVLVLESQKITKNRFFKPRELSESNEADFQTSLSWVAVKELNWGNPIIHIPIMVTLNPKP